MTSEFDTAAETAATGGVGGPSAKFVNIGDTFSGEIVGIDGMDVTVFGSNPAVIELLSNGQPARQMVVTLKTELRNWDRVAKVPKDDKGQPKPGSEDDGFRNVYAPFSGKSNKSIFTAISRAVAAAGATGAPKVGGKLAVRLSELRDTGKGNPAKLFEAKYEAPAAPSAFDAPAAAAAAIPAQRVGTEQLTAPASAPGGSWGGSFPAQPAF